MKFRYIFLFIVLNFKVYSNYREVSTKHVNLKVHKDIAFEDIDIEVMDRAYQHIVKYIGGKRDKKKIYVTLYDVDRHSSGLSTNRESESDTSFVRLSNTRDFTILDRSSFDFVLCYELAQKMIKDRVRDAMGLLKYLDYVYSLTDRLYRIVYPEWFVKGLALHIASEFSPSSKRNIALISKYSELAVASFKKRGIKEKDLFVYVNSNSFHSKFLFAHLLNFVSKEVGHDILKDIVQKALSDYKAKGIFSANTGLSLFLDSVDNRISSYWNSIDESKYVGDFSNVSDYHSILSMKSGNELWYLEQIENRIGIHRLNGKVLYGYDIAHFDVVEDDIYFTSKFLDIDNDKIKYNLYKNGRVIKIGVPEKFKITPEGIYWVENHGLRDRIYFESEYSKREILSLDYGIKVEDVTYLDGELFVSGSKEDEELKIYNVTALKEIDNGHAIFSDGEYIYYLSDEDDRIFRFNRSNSKRETIYLGEVSRATYLDGLYISSLEIDRERIKRVSDSVIDSDIIVSKRIEREAKAIVLSDIREKNFIKFYPDLDLFSLGLGVTFNMFKGSLIKAKFLELSIYWSIMESIREKTNPRMKFLYALSIYSFRRVDIIPFGEMSYALLPGSDNYIKIGFKVSFKDTLYNRNLIYSNNAEIEVAAKVGIREEDMFKRGLSIRFLSPIFCQYYTGSLAEEVELPEYRWHKLVDVIKESKDVRGKREGTHFLILGVGNKFNLNVNLILKKYRLRIRDLRLGWYAYILKDFVRSESIITSGPLAEVVVQIYNLDFVTKFYYIFEAKDGKFNNSKFGFDFSINIGG